jgi:predicted outer membrane repeat protein
MRRSALVLGVCLALAFACAARGKIIYVDDDANAPGDGKSWQTAYQYLQDALADAKGADKPVEIRVAQGIYKPNQRTDQTEWRIWFQVTSGVALVGGYAGISASGRVDPNVRDIPRYETILSGDLAGNDVEVNDPRDLEKEPTRADNTGVLQISQADNALLDGITIAGGHVISPVHGQAGPGGAGIFITDSNPTITSCTFRGNWAQGSGGAVDIRTGHPRLEYCTFVKNHAFTGGAIRGGQDATMIGNCLFTGNTADSEGGAVIGCAGTISNCTFGANSATTGGGGALAACRGLIANCLFLHNTAGDYGGAINNSGFELTFQ